MFCKVDEWTNLIRNSYNDPTIYITGDFNFPFLSDCNSDTIQEIVNNVHDRRENGKISSSDKLQAVRLIELSNAHYLKQFITEPTHQDNILDYVFSNKEDFIRNTEYIVNIFCQIRTL